MTTQETHGDGSPYEVPGLDAMQRLTPEFAATYRAFADAIWRHGVLPPRIKALMLLAMNAAATHLFEPGVKRSIEMALRCGASREEILEVLQIVSVVGIHSCTIGVPILLEELQNAGKAPPARDVDADPRLSASKASFVERRGYWSSPWDALLSMAPEFFDAFTDFSSAPWDSGPLEPKVKEFLYIAMDASATHLYERGLRVHIRNALRYGASAQELLEVIQLVSLQGIHTFVLGAPALEAQLEAVQRSEETFHETR